MEKQIKSTLVYQGHIFHITKDEVLIKGRVRQRDVVHHHGGVGVLALCDHKILLVKQYRYAVSCYMLEIPAGKLEQGEDPLTCGARELEEESGYRSCKELQPLCSMYSTPGFCNEMLYLYWTKQVVKVENPAPMDEDEEIEIVWVELCKAKEMIENQEIIDAKTIVAIQYALLQQNEKA